MLEIIIGKQHLQHSPSYEQVLTTASNNNIPENVPLLHNHVYSVLQERVTYQAAQNMHHFPNTDKNPYTSQ
jgi:hypothetical protein